MGNPLRIQIEAWEEDYPNGQNGDDQYQTFQVIYSTFWQYIQYINTGWHSLGYRVDKGDCRYTIQFRMDTLVTGF